MDIGIRELRDGLSRHLASVREGHTITVTDHGKPIARIIPVDSEHSALYQLIHAEPPGTVDHLVLTASGGPFRGRTDLSAITTDEALAHPTWEMGGRITIDSATLMNKGFELIEAHHLFGVPYERIDVVVHPQSIVHALVNLNDGASLAHLGYPDMKVPISYALNYPERADVEVPTLDLASVGQLAFERLHRDLVERSEPRIGGYKAVERRDASLRDRLGRAFPGAHRPLCDHHR